jgi:chemotaxis protein MotC
MTPRRAAIGPALAVLAVLALSGRAAAEAAALEPYQMVRSLQLVQDTIASGDDAALPMQRKLLELIDQRYRKAKSHDFVDQRNYQAMLVYAMSGGNPATIDSMLAKLHLSETDRALGTGILGYLRGDAMTARNALALVDPLKQPPELGAFLALVKGSVAAADDPVLAQRMFDVARLLSPGTLVEEAALRRSIALASESRDVPHFLLSCSQYVRRYLQSPYASQFADALVTGVVALRDTIDLAGVDDIIEGMDPERQKVVYLRLARRAAIDGQRDLAQYASAKAEAVKIEGAEPGADPRALLYTSLATITSDNVDQVLATLKGIDRSRLSVSDRQLLAAAEAIAAEVTAAPGGPAEAGPKPVQEQINAAVTEPVTEDLPEAEPLDTPAADALPTAHDATSPARAGAPRVVYGAAPAVEASPAVSEGAAAAPPAAETAAETDSATGISVNAPHEAEAPIAETASDSPADANDPTGRLVVDAHKKLEEIDRLLKDAAQ